MALVAGSALEHLCPYEWTKDSKQARYVRTLGRREPQHDERYREFVDTRPAVVVTNRSLCLVHQANDLIDQQRATLEQERLKSGGLRERMTKARRNQLKKNDLG